MSEHAGILFVAQTPLGFTVRVTNERWRVITTFKHPAMVGCQDEVKAVLEAPEQIRRSRSDENVLLFYRQRASAAGFALSENVLTSTPS